MAGTRWLKEVSHGGRFVLEFLEGGVLHERHENGSDEYWTGRWEEGTYREKGSDYSAPALRLFIAGHETVLTSNGSGLWGKEYRGNGLSVTLNRL